MWRIIQIVSANFWLILLILKSLFLFLEWTTVTFITCWSHACLGSVYSTSPGEKTNTAWKQTEKCGDFVLIQIRLALKQGPQKQILWPHLRLRYKKNQTRMCQPTLARNQCRGFPAPRRHRGFSFIISGFESWSATVMAGCWSSFLTPAHKSATTSNQCSQFHWTWSRILRLQ